MTKIIDAQDRQAIIEARRNRRANKSKGPTNYTVLSRFKSSGYEPTGEARTFGMCQDAHTTKLVEVEAVVEVLHELQRCNHSLVYYGYIANGEKHFGYAELDSLADLLTPKSVDDLLSEHGDVVMALMVEHINTLQ